MEVQRINLKIRNFSLVAALILGGVVLFSNQAFASVLHKVPNNLGLVGYWAMEDATGTQATDFSGNGNTGTLISSPTWIGGTAAKRGTALSFNGSSTYVTMGSVSAAQFASTSPYTFSAWIKVDSAATGIETIVSYASSGAQGWYLNWDAGALVANGMYCDYYSGSALHRVKSSTNSVRPGSGWHHVVCLHDGSNTTAGRYMYIDGVDDTTRSNNGTPVDIDYSGLSLEIGARGTTAGGNFVFNGLIDDTRIYSRALSAAEVTALYNSGKATVNTSLNTIAPSNLLLWHSFDGSYLNTTTSTDRSGQGNNGTLAGASGTQNKPQPVLGKVGQALNFDGTDDYVDLGSATVLTSGSPFSISWWEKIQADTNGYPSRFILKMSGTTDYFAVVRIQSDTNYNNLFWGKSPIAGGSFAIRSTAAPSTAASVGVWNHFVLTGSDPSSLTPGNYSLYVNGVSTAVSATGANVGTLTTNRIGWDGGDSGTDATLDDVRVYNRALSASEVVALYNSSKATVNVSSNNIAPSSLVDWHSFDGSYLNTSTSTDRSGQANHARLSGGPLPTIGKIGQGLSFDGIDDFVTSSSTTNLPTGQGARTIAFWMYQRTRVLDVNSAFVDMTNGGSGQSFTVGVSFVFDSVSNKTFLFTDSTNANNNVVIDGSEIPSLNAWHQIIFTFNGGTDWVYYLDGVNTKSGTFSTTINTNTSGVDIGRRSSAVTGYIDGLIDDVRIYSTALSAADAMKLYLQGK